MGNGDYGITRRLEGRTVRERDRAEKLVRDRRFAAALATRWRTLRRRAGATSCTPPSPASGPCTAPRGATAAAGRCWTGGWPNPAHARQPRAERQLRRGRADAGRPTRPGAPRAGSGRACGRPPRRSGSRSGGRRGRSRSSTVWSVAISRKPRSSSAASSSEPVWRGVSVPGFAAAASTPSSVPWARRRSRAVFSPMPFAPGRPSDGSPRRAMKSGTCSGSIP